MCAGVDVNIIVSAKYEMIYRLCFTKYIAVVDVRCNYVSAYFIV